MGKKAPFIFFLIIIFAGVLLFLNLSNSFLQNNFLQKNPLPDNAEEGQKLAEDQIIMEYDCEPGVSAYEVLEEKASNIEFEGSSFGRMVTGINGINQGNGKYWLYLVNGKDATVSADSYICAEEEKIKWELR